MKCLHPHKSGYQWHGCGQCMNCRINLKRTMTCRILLEAMTEPWSLFITLTYNDSNVRLNEDGVPTLRPDDMANFRRRFERLVKTKIGKGALRWYGVGEYGEDQFVDKKLPIEERYAPSNIKAYGRPHYHMLLFGCGAECEPLVEQAWNSGDDINLYEGKATRGFVQTGILNADRAAYIAGYTTKKMTKHGDDRLMRRWPEFSRWSKMGLLRGIGFPAVGWLADEMSRGAAMKQLARYGDVFSTVRIDGKVYPLGNYLRKHLREAIGIPQKAIDRWEYLGLVDQETGEVTTPEPMPEYYGPWKDALQANFPLVLRHGQEKNEIDLYFAEKGAAKRSRQTRQTGVQKV